MISTTADLDVKRYARLLAKAVPIVIDSEEENERVLGIVEELMAKGEDNLSREEDALLELLVDLVHDFEAKAYPAPACDPHAALEFLMEQRGLKPSDLLPIIGSRSRISEILAGKRSISKSQAKKLAEFFRVKADLFI